ncbi:MAG: glycosyltransferase family 2 protein [Rhodanobacteraceae bacterium]
MKPAPCLDEDARTLKRTESAAPPAQPPAESGTREVPDQVDAATAPALRLSVIIPLAPGETDWQELLRQLGALPAQSEVILVHAEQEAVQQPPAWPESLRLRAIASTPGRARQQNVGAEAARGRWLWFLHADSRMQRSTLSALCAFLDTEADAMGYFDLVFAADGPRLAKLNAWGANLRSRWLRLPFGDQGLLLPATRFAELGRFDEQARCGEDHLLVWAAHQAGLPVCGLGASLQTSARKYRRHGWLGTTLRHWRLTLAQAWPAWRRMRRNSR